MREVKDHAIFRERCDAGIRKRWTLSLSLWDPDVEEVTTGDCNDSDYEMEKPCVISLLVKTEIMTQTV